jgi:DNA polymerase-4
VITPKQGLAFVENLPVAKFHGVGPATAEKMRRLGIATGRDLKTCSLELLQENFGKAGLYYYAIARGIDERPVRPDRERKSVGAERTFLTDLFTFEQAAAALPAIIVKVWRACEGAKLYGRTLTLKVKYSDFQQVTRSQTDVAPIATVSEFEHRALALLAPIVPTRRGVRLLGLTLSSFGPTFRQSDEQLSFELIKTDSI